MFVRKLPTATVNAQGFTFTLSRKIGSTAAKAAATYVVGLKGAVLKAPDVADAIGLLEEAHATLDVLDSILASLADELSLLKAALNVLDGNEEISVGGQLVEAAVSAKTYLAALHAADPDFDTTKELEDCVQTLKRTIAELTQQHEAVTRNRADLDQKCRALTLLACAHKDFGTTKDGETRSVWSVTNRFELPEEIERDCEALGPTETVVYLKDVVAGQLRKASEARRRQTNQSRKEAKDKRVTSADRAKAKLQEVWQ